MKTLSGSSRTRRARAVTGALLLPVLLSAQPLSYTVSWLGIPVVDVALTLVAGDSSLQAEYQARTRPWFDYFYAVDNRYRVWVDPGTGYPARYEKRILERGRANHLEVRYERNPRRVVYANGLERPWPDETHTLFSALLWVQRHDWKPAEERQLLVEVEGVVWEVAVASVKVVRSGKPGEPLVEVRVRFDRQVSGEPVLSDTDILTRLLPGEGHELRFGLDPRRDVVKWVEFGSKPFMVRAELNSAPERP